MKKTSFHLILIIMVGLIAYSNTFKVPFQFDDFNNITDNPLISNLDNFISSSNGYDHNPRRYIGYLTFALNYRFGGLDVTGYHIVNLVIHILNAILVYLLVALTFKTPYFRHETLDVKRETSETQDQESRTDSRFTIHDSRSSIALFSSLLFVAHPLQTQAVTYIVQRFTSLATLFYLLSIVLYIKGRLAVQRPVPDHQFPASRQSAHGSQVALSVVYYLLSLASAVLAMKTKEIAFTLPLVIILYESIFFKNGVKKNFLILVPVVLTLMIIPVSIMGTNRPLGEILSDLSEKTRVHTEIPRTDYLATEMRVITTYIRLIFLPVNQNLDYDYPIYHSFLVPQVFLSSIFLLSLLGTAVWLLYRNRQSVTSDKQSAGGQSGGQAGERLGNDSMAQQLNKLPPPFTIHLSRLIAFGILWFFIALSVESSIIPITDVIFEHRVYLPSAGAFVAVAAAMSGMMERFRRLRRRGNKEFVPFALIIIVLSFATFARNSVWNDKALLWEDTIRKAPSNARAHNNLGFVYYERGMLEQAAEQLAAALRLRPWYSDARINLGIVYNAEGMVDQAVEQFMRVLSVNPDDVDAHNNLGIAYVSRGMFDQGIVQYQIALTLKPDYPEAYNNLGVALSSQDRFEEAIDCFRDALRLKPDYYEAKHNLALAYKKRGEIGAAARK